MSSGKTHAGASLFLAVAGGLGVSLQGRSDIAAAIGAGCLLGIILSPDLDQPTLTHGEWLVIKRVPIFGWLWVAYWSMLYARIPHRHWLSHAPIIGTAGRLVYLLLPLLVLGVRLPVNAWTLGGVFGLCASDVLHWIMDRI